MKALKIGSAALTAIFVAACSSTPEKVDPYPDWFYSPIIENGLASAKCVPIPASNISVAQQQAVAEGRADIASQISIRVKAMDKTYNRVTNTNQGPSTGGTFESVSKQVTNQVLSGARATKYKKIVDEGKNLMCAFVTLSPEDTSGLLDGLIKAAEVNLSPTNEAVLREEFKAYKAQQELDAEIQKQGS